MRALPPLAVASLAAGLAAQAVGDTFDADGRIVGSLHVTHEGPSGEPDYASLTVYERGADNAGWVDWTCFDHQPAPDVSVFVYDVRSSARQAEGVPRQ